MFLLVEARTDRLPGAHGRRRGPQEGVGARGRHAGSRRGAQGGRLGAPVHAWVLVGPVLVLVHLAEFSTWFLDSVLFLRHRLDLVHEHCTSQNFLKCFLIKLIKNEQKNNKLFKNKIFVIKII